MTRRIALLAATALAVAGIGRLAALAVDASLRDTLSGHPGLTVASVSAQPFAGRLVLRGLATDGAVKVTVDRLDLPLRGFDVIATALADAATPAAGSVASAEGVGVTSGGVTYRVKRIDMTGTSLSSADLAALLDQKTAQPIEARLKALSASAIVMPEILMDDATPGSERHATLSQIVLSGVASGKVAAGSIGGIAFAAKTGDDNIAGRTGAIQATMLDLPQIAHVIGTQRRDDTETLKPLYGSASASHVEIRNEKNSSSVAIAVLRASGVRARPLKTAPPAQDVAPKDANAAALDDLAHSFAIDSLEATDIVMHGNVSDGGSASLSGLTMRDAGDGRIGNVATRGFAFAAPKVKLALTTLDLGPIVVPRPKQAGAATSAMLPRWAGADLRGLEVEVVAERGDTGPTRFTVDHAGFTSDGDPDDLPKTAKATIDDLKFDLPPRLGTAQPLVEMGYSHLDLSSVFATRYDGGTHDFELQPLSVNGVSMGRLDLGLRLANVTKGIISQNKEIARASALSVLAKGLSLDLVNDGLIDRAIAWKAKQDGLDILKEKSFLADFFSDKLPSSLGDSANLRIVGTAIAKFVMQPRNLHISIASQSGLGMGSVALLADPGLLIDTLEVKASANE